MKTTDKSLIPLDYIPGTPMESYLDFLKDIQNDPQLLAAWEILPNVAKDEIKSYYSKEKVPRITSDPIFKHIFNPETHPERLSELLSLLIGEPIQVVASLPLENIPLSFYSKQVILDILVKLQDGSLANVEMQRAALDFSPQRAVVLSSNLVVRQFTTLSRKLKHSVNYQDIRKVYTVVLLEQDYPCFRNHPEAYLHKSRQVFDTGVELDMLQEYIYVELSKFNRLIQNIDSSLDAWLKFILTRTPHDILSVIHAFSTFQNLYNDVTIFMKDRKELIQMAFQAVTELDENSIIDMLKRKDETIAEQQELIASKDHTLAEKDVLIKKLQNELTQTKTMYQYNE